MLTEHIQNRAFGVCTRELGLASIGMGGRPGLSDNCLINRETWKSTQQQFGQVDRLYCRICGCC